MKNAIVIQCVTKLHWSTSITCITLPLQGISPLIWSRLLVRSDMSLATLHAALQVVFA
jgi:hypothetical protein